MSNLDWAEEDSLELRQQADIEYMCSTDGWKLIDSMIQDKLEVVRLKKAHSDDPSVVMACVRQEDGLNFIYEVIEEFEVKGNQSLPSDSEIS